MAEFIVDVVVDPRRAERGLRRVKRGMREVTNGADKLRDTIKKAFAAFGILLVVRQLVILTDAFTNLQNRLRIVTSGTAQLNRVTEELFQVAQRSRSSFEATAVLYQRVSLAAQSLGADMSNLSAVVESVNKAIIVSGASAKEANNGLIQLSQGIAANRLGGDELRSVLEQLPFVADIIAREFGVTRGELRKLGEEGAITGQIILDAFRNSADVINEEFAKTVPTLSQSFVILRNSVLRFVGIMNEATAITRSLGGAMRFLADNLVFLGKAALVVGAAFAALKLSRVIAKTAALATQTKLLATIEVEAAAAEARSAQITTFRTTAIIRQIRAEQLRAVAVAGSANAMFIQAAIEKQLVALEAQLLVETQALAVSTERLAAANARAAATGNIFARTLTRIKVGIRGVLVALGPIGIAVVGITALVAAFTLFRDDIKLSENRIASLGDLIRAFIETVKIAFSTLADIISVLVGPELEALGNLFRDLFKDIDFSFEGFLRLIARSFDFVIDTVVGAFNIIKAVFLGLPKLIGSGIIQGINAIIGAIEFVVDALAAAFATAAITSRNIGSAIVNFFRQVNASLGLLLTGQRDAALTLAKDAAEGFGNSLKRSFLDIDKTLGSQFKKFRDDDLIPTIDNIFEGAGGDIGNAILQGLKDAEGTGQAETFLDTLLSRAEEIAKDRARAAAEDVVDTGGGAGDPVAVSAFVENAAAIAKETRLLGMLSDERERATAIQKFLTEARKRDQVVSVFQIATLTALLAVQQEAGRLSSVRQKIFDKFRGTTEKLNALDVLRTEILMDQNRTLEEKVRLLELIRLEQAELGTSIQDGLVRGAAAVTEALTDVASAAENALVNAFQSAEDTLVEFVKTGKVDFRQFALDIIGDIARIVTKLLVLEAFELFAGGGGEVKATELIAAATTLQTAGFTLGVVTPALQTAATTLQAAASTLLTANIIGAATGGGAIAGAEHGGPVRANEPIIVGEREAELFVPQQSGRIFNQDQIRAALAQSGTSASSAATQVTVNVPPATINIRAEVDAKGIVAAGLEGDEGDELFLGKINTNRENINTRLAR